MRRLLGAVSFLTRIPAGASMDAEPAMVAKSARWFPFVGFALGCVYAGAAWLLLRWLPALVVAVLLLALDAVLTGALHLDGLADMADGFGGGRTREDVLRIMRDHAIGSYGAAALILVLLLKAACLSELLRTRHGLWILFIAPALGRWTLVLLSYLEPYARSGDAGTGSVAKWIGGTELAIATLTCIPLPFLFGVERSSICWGAVALVTVLVAWICDRRIGGITGDILGANTVVAECVQFVLAAAAQHAM
ncbi:MAG TPA: adenosylcobinamide-GDP ribazoletransferase [Bryobacteraceae bacterium]|jgi:cobalamin 5'-phosphate synthase/cobalamin synthase|nr:adenosylcobinamide-GDP ribazoletransferase [Bryobacteraceae bacterium]